MQILGKRSKVLLIAVAITMLVAIGVSFAMWDNLSVVKATTGYVAYSTAQVGDVIQYGRYYQTGLIGDDGEYEKTPIDWLVVDKDERIGQLTLMSKYILACGSYFGNWYDDGTESGYNWNYNKTQNEDSTFTYSKAEVGDIAYSQAYVDSTARAYLNNLERLDMGGDEFTADGYFPSNKNSTISTGLLSSVGFSNQRYWTNQFSNASGQTSLLSKPGFIKRADTSELYYQRPINNEAYTNRPATKGFLDEAFTEEEKSMIVPKVIAGYLGHRWPDGNHDVSTKSYVEGTFDKVWLPSATELNVANGLPWNFNSNKPDSCDDQWTNPSDQVGSTVFEYFKNLSGDALRNALKTTRTELASDGKAGNYSIPVYDKGTMNIKTAINASTNTSDDYWTRSPMSYWYRNARTVSSSGLFYAWASYYSNVGVRPCIIIKY